MAASPSTKNYTLMKGMLYFDKLSESTGLYLGERNLGNAPAVNFNVSLEALEHFSSTGGLKAKDKKVIAQITPQFNFTLDEISAENMGMLLTTTPTAVTQAADDDQTALLTDVAPGFWYETGDREIGIYALGYDTGTVIFAIGEVVSGATGVGTVVERVGDATSGTLYLNTLTAGFVDNEALTGDGSGAAAANGVEAFLTSAVSVEDTDAAGTFFVAGTDFTVDSGTGRISPIVGGAIDGTTVTNLTVCYGILGATYYELNGLSETQLEGKMRFVSDNPVGNQLELEIWRVSLVPAGDTALIGDDWSTLSFEGEILKDDTGHPTHPYLKMIITEQA